MKNWWDFSYIGFAFQLQNIFFQKMRPKGKIVGTDMHVALNTTTKTMLVREIMCVVLHDPDND
uniref:Uncharacterized protein n=1 Tax=Cucumis sativus TaxID=3659 RepID=A0A0A0L3W7_CUCSA